MSARGNTVTGQKRETWSGQTAFLLAAIGSAIGLGNIWRFPGVAYSNGGGAFMIPYLVAMIFVGIPVLLLDYSIGHRLHGTPPLALKRLAGRFGEGLGWFQVGVCFVIFVYYAVIIAWSLRYTIYSINMAWGSDPGTFFSKDFLQVEGAAQYSLTPVGNVMIPLALVWVAVLFIMGRGIQGGVETANKIMLPLLVVLFGALVVRALFLPGAVDGLNALFTPQWSALGDSKVWIAAFAQIFYSLSVAFGIMLTYASYLRPKSNLVGTGLVAGLANSSFEILAGIGVFAALGFMASQQGIGVGDLEGLTGVSLSFITFPKLITMMPGGPLFGILFFLSLTFAGLTSLISLLQVVSGGIQDKFGFSTKQATMIMAVPAMIVSLGLFGMQSGLSALDVIDNYINGIGVVGSAIALTVTAAVAGPRLEGFRKHLNAVSSIKVPRFWTPLVGIIIPLVLAFMLVTFIIDLVRNGYGDYSASYTAIMGWGCVIAAVVFAVIMVILPWKRTAAVTESTNEFTTEGTNK